MTSGAQNVFGRTRGRDRGHPGSTRSRRRHWRMRRPRRCHGPSRPPWSARSPAGWCRASTRSAPAVADQDGVARPVENWVAEQRAQCQDVLSEDWSLGTGKVLESRRRPWQVPQRLSAPPQPSASNSFRRRLAIGSLMCNATCRGSARQHSRTNACSPARGSK